MDSGLQQGDFKVGDLGVYFEIDSWCDSSIPAFQSDVFVARYSNWGTKRGMRLKTIKLRKQISQGLFLRLDQCFPAPFPNGEVHIEEGADVTEVLGMNPGVKREGVVFKSNSSEFSFKAISNSYLLAKEKQMDAELKLAA